MALFTLKLILRIVLAGVISLAVIILSNFFTRNAEEKRRLVIKQPGPLLQRVKNGYVVFSGILIALTTTAFVPLLYSYCMLLCVCVIIPMDYRHRIIPNQTILSMLICKIVLSLPSAFGIGGFLPCTTATVLSSVMGMILLMVMFAVPSLTTGKMGYGDVKLAGTIGFCLGLSGGLMTVALCGLLLLIYVICQPIAYTSAKLITFTERLRQKLPLGVSLGVAMMITLTISNCYPVQIFNFEQNQPEIKQQVEIVSEPYTEQVLASGI